MTAVVPPIYPKVQYHLVEGRIKALKETNGFEKVNDRKSFHHPLAENLGLKFEQGSIRKGFISTLFKPLFDFAKNAYNTLCGGATATYTDVASATCAEALIQDPNIHAVTDELTVKFHKPIKKDDELELETVVDPNPDVKSDMSVTVYSVIRKKNPIDEKDAKPKATSIAKIAFLDANGNAVPTAKAFGLAA